MSGVAFRTQRQRLCMFWIASAVAVTLAAFYFLAPRHRLAQQETAAIAKRYAGFQTEISAGNFAAAYECMSPSYRASHDLADFTSHFAILRYDAYKIGSKPGFLVKGGWAEFCPKTGSIFGVLRPFSGTSFVLSKENGVWYFTGEMHSNQN